MFAAIQCPLQHIDEGAPSRLGGTTRGNVAAAFSGSQAVQIGNQITVEVGRRGSQEVAEVMKAKVTDGGKVNLLFAGKVILNCLQLFDVPRFCRVQQLL